MARYKPLRLAAAGALASALCLSVPPHSAQAAVFVHLRPPAARAEVIPSRPHPGWVWAPGYWRWLGRRWAWVGGYWANPPYVGAVWIPGHWVHRPLGWVWIPGHWA
ncbi:MAG TPA: hypothetical protein VHY79_02770 [Rhizomicrobium sp.]|nr:hypothetical protein [Rhizomicrobium sp.]